MNPRSRERFAAEQGEQLITTHPVGCEFRLASGRGTAAAEWPGVQKEDVEMLRMILFGLISLLFASACASDSSDFVAADILDQMPSGSMEGTAWTAMGAQVSSSFGGDELSVELVPTELDDQCGFVTSDSSILFSVPAVVGEYPLSFDFGSLDSSRTITFVPAPASNVIASTGLIVVEAVSETEVTIGLVAEAGDSRINGRFTAPRCP